MKVFRIIPELIEIQHQNAEFNRQILIASLMYFQFYLRPDLFLLVDLRDFFFSDLGLGGQKK